MDEYAFYNLLVKICLGIAAVIAIALYFITAPYGRHTKTGWGPLIGNRTGWIIMEAPASLLMFFYFFFGGREISVTLIILLLLWQVHYFHRSFIYPFQITGGRMPVTIMLSGLLFNVINTYIQGRWVFHFSPESEYQAGWLCSPFFIIGAVLFFAGYFINKQSDYILQHLRKPGETGYKIPRGGMYRFVSCPNYLGEILEWIGWGVATWSLAGAVFAIWTAANLVPRAYAHHKWYREKFPDYPEERKALIPFLY